MEKNNLVTPPQLADVKAGFDAWQKAGYWGSRKDFYGFLSSPSPERDRFVMEQNVDLRQYGSVIAPTII